MICERRSEADGPRATARALGIWKCSCLGGRPRLTAGSSDRGRARAIAHGSVARRRRDGITER
eukprot:2504414-Pyramimonas_sp.AAC.1